MNTVNAYGDMSETQIIDLCMDKDHLAFREFVNRFLGKVQNLVKKYIKDPDTADDVIQEIFLKAWKSLKKFDREKMIKPWLLTIARNTALDNLKKRKALSFSQYTNDDDSTAFLETIADDNKLASEIYEDKEKLELLQNKIELLHPDQRIILSLYYEEELTFEEISRIIDKPMNTIKSLHRRTLILLGKLMTETLHQNQ